MKKAVVSLITGLAGTLVLIVGLYEARIGFGSTSFDLIIAAGLAFVGIILIGTAISRLSEPNGQ